MKCRRPTALLLAILLFGLSTPRGAEAADHDERAACSEAYESAQRLRRKGSLRAARRELVVCARESCPTALATDCLRWLGEVESAQPSVVVAVVDPEGRDVLDARVSVDEAPMSSGATDPGEGRAFDVDPGRHRIRVVAPGQPAVEETVVVREGEKRRTVRVVLGRRPGSSATATSPAERDERAEPAERAERDRALPFTLLGIGAASLAGAGIVGIYGLTQRSGLEGCRPDCNLDRVDAANRSFLVSDILLAVGVVVAGVGAYLFLSQPTAPTSARRP